MNLNFRKADDSSNPTAEAMLGAEPMPYRELISGKQAAHFPAPPAIAVVFVDRGVAPINRPKRALKRSIRPAPPSASRTRPSSSSQFKLDDLRFLATTNGHLSPRYSQESLLAKSQIRTQSLERELNVFSERIERCL